MGQRGNIEDIESFLSEAIRNIRDDRAITNSLLIDLISEIKNTSASEAHKNLGIIAAKYVETLQRSNEQLVKVSALLQKKSKVSENLTEEDKTELFDIIQESP
tara:strand:- start:896 stop:1204 length:309 start_codon:yes stop_codon:yes gene_type:complete